MPNGRIFSKPSKDNVQPHPRLCQTCGAPEQRVAERLPDGSVGSVFQTCECGGTCLTCRNKMVPLILNGRKSVFLCPNCGVVRCPHCGTQMGQTNLDVLNVEDDNTASRTVLYICPRSACEEVFACPS